MRWIHHNKMKGKIMRGNGEPPMTNDVFIVNEHGSIALVNGRLYIDGKLAEPGIYRIDLGDKVLPIEVIAGGIARVRRSERKGGARP